MKILKGLVKHLGFKDHKNVKGQTLNQHFMIRVLSDLNHVGTLLRQLKSQVKTVDLPVSECVEMKPFTLSDVELLKISRQLVEMGCSFPKKFNSAEFENEDIKDVIGDIQQFQDDLLYRMITPTGIKIQTGKSWKKMFEGLQPDQPWPRSDVTKPTLEAYTMEYGKRKKIADRHINDTVNRFTNDCIFSGDLVRSTLKSKILLHHTLMLNGDEFNISVSIIEIGFKFFTNDEVNSAFMKELQKPLFLRPVDIKPIFRSDIDRIINNHIKKTVRDSVRDYYFVLGLINHDCQPTTMAKINVLIEKISNHFVIVRGGNCSKIWIQLTVSKLIVVKWLREVMPEASHLFINEFVIELQKVLSCKQ